jgi:hypothetical protein
MLLRALGRAKIQVYAVHVFVLQCKVGRSCLEKYIFLNDEFILFSGISNVCSYVCYKEKTYQNHK